MDIKFDAQAADKLIRDMDKYCTSIQKEGKDLLNIMKDPVDWQDNQMRAFQTSVKALTEDLNKALALESEYMRTFYKRITELKE